jgi:hypothetical protein
MGEERLLAALVAVTLASARGRSPRALAADHSSRAASADTYEADGTQREPRERHVYNVEAPGTYRMLFRPSTTRSSSTRPALPHRAGQSSARTA